MTDAITKLETAQVSGVFRRGFNGGKEDYQREKREMECHCNGGNILAYMNGIIFNYV